MYESPITLYKIEPTFSIKDDLATFEQKYKYVVNEEELYKALTYDRDQYNYGYNDGFREGYEQATIYIKEYIEKLKEKFDI